MLRPGETTPSVKGVEVIGEVRDDYAINVHLDGRDEDLWFADDLVEFVDHAAGTEMWRSRTLGHP